MKITYDKKADAAYIKLSDKAVYDASKKITPDVVVDYAKDGTIVGIEILDASRNMPLPTQSQVTVESIG